MLKMPDTKAKFFSVTHSTKIYGVQYVPSVCYALPSNLQNVIAEMEGKGLARTYTERVRFVTGVPYPVKKPGASPVVRMSFASTSDSDAVSAEKPTARKSSATIGKLGRKPGRTGREFD
jgi:hypothetical protein